ncbi:LolA family protein [Hanstruepera neustonica]|nr:outer membrane lipoprotein carrier protein LolA [Hanstruepera neustonica]
MRKIFFIPFFLISANFFAQSPMNSQEAAALKTLVKTRAATTKTITSDFTQSKHLDFLDNDVVTKGQLAFKSPNLIKWSYVDPFKYSVIFKNETLYINDEGNKSNIDIGSNQMFKQLNKLIINSIKGDMFDDETFSIEYFKNDHSSLVQFASKDKKLSKYISAFHITFNSNGDVEQVKMIEPSGDYTKIVFSNRVLNNSINEAVFSN